MDAQASAPSVDSEAAITAVFEAQYTRLCRLAYLLTGDASRAEEVVMDAFVRSLAAWRLRRPDQPSAYVRRAVVNLSRNRRRRFWHERRHGGTPPAAAVIPTEPVDHIWAAVRNLPQRQRAAVIMRYWDDLGEAEIADALGCSRGTVKSQLSKARATLTTTLKIAEEQ